MSNLTRRQSLARSVLAAVRGKANGSMEEDRPEDMETEDQEENASSEEEDTSAEGETKDEDMAAEGEEKDEGETKDEPEASSADRIRRAEQGRIRAILTHPKAEANAGLANELAFGSKFYSAASACALLESSSPGGSRLADRMQGRTPQLGSGGGAAKPNERQAVVARVGSIVKAIHGRNKKES